MWIIDGYGVIGGCGIFYTLPDRPEVVVKVAIPSDRTLSDFEIEKRVYRRLREHPHLVHVFEINEYGIYLALASNGCLRLYYEKGGKATLHERVTWCRDITAVVEYVHQKNVRHGDLSGRNMLLDSDRKILLCDFSGSYIDGESATIIAEVGFRYPDKNENRLPTIRAELYALGSLLYEIIVGKKPYHNLEDNVVLERMAREEYPNVSDLPLGNVIMGCWTGEFASAADVGDAITQASIEDLRASRRGEMYRWAYR